jgi:hypothetical protein
LAGAVSNPVSFTESVHLCMVTLESGSKAKPAVVGEFFRIPRV